jgi:competence protein ComEC
VTVIDSNQANSFLGSLFSLKHRLMGSIEASISEPYAGLGEGLLLGVKQALGEELENDFRTTGIIHIVVLSGYNIMIVVSFVLFIISFFTRSHWRALFGIVAIVCFALLVGLSATVVRASIMASLLLIATTYHRTYDIFRALLLAGAVMLFINPWLLLYDIGFQLSFMATLGLILVAPRFEGLVVTQPLAVKAKEYVIATVATQIAVLPLLMYHIGEISLIAVVVNLLVLPIVPLAMFSTFVTGLLGIFSSTVAVPFAWLSTLVLAYVISVAQFGASIPLASVLVPTFPAVGVLALYAVMIGILWHFHKQKQQPKNILSDWEIVEESILIKKELA